MILHRSESSTIPKAPHLRARKDLWVIGAVALLGCLVVIADPDRAFEWIASHKEVQVNEFLTAVVILGSGFALFSWRRWTDLSRQVAEYERLQSEMSTISREASLMSETDDLLQSCLSGDEAYKIVIRHLEAQFPAMHGAIFSMTLPHNTAELATKWGSPAISQDNFAVKDCWALRRGRVHISLSGDSRLACAHIGSQMPAYAICVPMVAQGETLGFLYMDTGTEKMSSGAAPMTDSEERIVKMLSEHLALAVANMNLRESLRTQSIRDPLTGLFNRRYMEESLEREFRRAARKETSLAVLMIDVDHFKRFNDTQGHEAGDAVLRELAKLFQSQLRAEDIVSRYGGEEFMLILPEADMIAARECGDRLRNAVHAMQIQHLGKTLEGIRLSIGVACHPQHGNNADALLRSADMALYHAKEAGRDQMVTADNLEQVREPERTAKTLSRPS